MQTPLRRDSQFHNLVRKVIAVLPARRVIKSLWTVYRLTTSLGLAGLVAAFQLGVARRQSRGVTRVLCGGRRRLTVRNGSSDIKVFEQHFARREIFDIPFDRDAAEILDLGANIGITVEVFRRLFPTARIIAVELDEHNARLCRLNHQSDELITVVHAAIWSESRQVSVKDVGDGSWALQVEPSATSSALITVPALTYDEILSLHGRRFVDVMKMDIEGAEADVLEASWKTIFGSTAVSIIEIHHWLDGIESRIDRVLAKARTTFELDIARSGEFWIIRNMALAAAPRGSLNAT